MTGAGACGDRRAPHRASRIGMGARGAFQHRPQPSKQISLQGQPTLRSRRVERSLHGIGDSVTVLAETGSTLSASTLPRDPDPGAGGGAGARRRAVLERASDPQPDRDPARMPRNRSPAAARWWPIARSVSSGRVETGHPPHFTQPRRQRGPFFLGERSGASRVCAFLEPCLTRVLRARRHQGEWAEGQTHA